MRTLARRMSPMFRHRDMVRPMTYSAALSFLHERQQAAGVSVKPGLHGVRVEGWSATVPLKHGSP